MGSLGQCRFENPFTTIFGGKPQSFFGRQKELDAFTSGLSFQNPDGLMQFITGPRAIGKTTLIEHMAQMAKEANWLVVRIYPSEPVRSMLIGLSDAEERIDASTAEGNLSLGLAHLTGSSTVSLKHKLGPSDLVPTLLQNYNSGDSRGIVIVIDEVQKADLDEMATVATAVQGASASGVPLGFLAAGLPGSRKPLIDHDGCTFLRRMPHHELELFRRSEVKDALTGGLEKAGVAMEASAMERAVAATSGHPYLTQAIGSSLVDVAAALGDRSAKTLQLDDVAVALTRASGRYARYVLRPILDELRPTEARYLTAFAQLALASGHPAVSSAGVAKALGKAVGGVSRIRRRLLDLGILSTKGLPTGYAFCAMPGLLDEVMADGSAKADFGVYAEWGLVELPTPDFPRLLP